jgi:hypothetical protein
MTARTYLRSFAGGEITPEMFGRLDLRQFQTGASRVRNFRTLPHGPLENRAGLLFVNETKTSSSKSVLLPFIYSSDQSIVLEFGDQYIRFHTLGGTVLEASQNIVAVSNANPGVLEYAGADNYANGDWVFVSDAGGMTELNGRYFRVKNVNVGANTFELADADGTDVNTSAFGTYTSGGTIAEVYTISSPYLEADLYDLHFTQSADVLTITHPTYQQRELRRLGATNWTLATLSFSPSQAAPTGVTISPSAAGGVSYTYAVTAIATDGQEESVVATATNAACTTLSSTVSNTITWSNAAGAVRYNVYRLLNGVYGYVGQSGDGTSGFLDDNISPDFSQTPPIPYDPFAGAGDYPGAVGYHRGRRWFAGTTNKPQNAWGTRSGTEKNLNYSIPSRDDDSINVRLTSRQANTIRHLVPLNDLLLLTSGAEWLVTTANSDILSPTTIDYKVQGYTGANNAQPIATSESVLFAQAQGGRIYELKYDAVETLKYRARDASIMAPHLFDKYTIKQMTWQRAPYPTAWFVRSDGILLGLTYMPDQQVAAWHWHDTDGEFESVCAVPESGVDVVYVVVKRTINGRTVRTIERQDERQITRLKDSFFVDCGATLDNSIAATLTPGTGANVDGTEAVVFTAGSSVFTAGDVGQFIHYDYEEIDDEGVRQYKTAMAEITAYTSGTIVEATILEPWPDTTAIASDGWRLTTDTVGGLWHLEGETVKVLADGAVHPDETVANGTITLDNPAAVVHVGLGYKADFRSLPMVMEVAAFGQTVKKNVNRVHLRVYASSGIQAGPTFSKLREVKQRTDEVYGEPPRLATGRYNLLVTPTWDDDAPICVRQDDPLPLTLVALAPEAAYGG